MLDLDFVQVMVTFCSVFTAASNSVRHVRLSWRPEKKLSGIGEAMIPMEDGGTARIIIIIMNT